MAALFTHGYALLIGVDQNQVPGWALPTVAKDVAALHNVLAHPERCAYPPDHVRRVCGPDATLTGILDGLDWLQAAIEADPEATAVLYYSGHGWRDLAAPDQVYLVPYDAREERLRFTALRAADLQARVAALRPRRLLVVLDCCHAAGLGVKSLPSPPAPLPPTEERGRERGEAPSPPAPLPLTEGRGRERGEAPSPSTPLSPGDGPGGRVSSPLPLGEGSGVRVPSGFLPTALPPAPWLAPPPASDAKGLDALAQGAGRAVLSSSRGDELSRVRRDRAMSVFTYHLIEALTGHAQPKEGASEVLVSDLMGHVTRRVPESVARHGHVQTPDFQVSDNFPIALLLGGDGLSKGVRPPDPLQDQVEMAATVPSVQIDTGGGMYVGGSVVNRGGTVVGRDYVAGDSISGDKVGGDSVAGSKYVGDRLTVIERFYEREAGAEALPADPERALATYLDHVVNTHRCLPLQGIRGTDELVSVDLEEVYISNSKFGRKPMPKAVIGRAR